MSKRTIKTLNWNDPSIWEGNIVPGEDDEIDLTVEIELPDLVRCSRMNCGRHIISGGHLYVMNSFVGGSEGYNVCIHLGFIAIFRNSCKHIKKLFSCIFDLFCYPFISVYYEIRIRI